MDYGFAQIFHPDPRGSSATVGGAQRDNSIFTCFSATRCLTVSLPKSSGPVKVTSHGRQTSTARRSPSSTRSRCQTPALPPKGKGEGQGPDGDVALWHGSSSGRNHRGQPQGVERRPVSVVDGRRRSALAARRPDQEDGAGDDDGPSRPVYADMLLTTGDGPEGDLVVKSWRLDGYGLEHLDTYRDESRGVQRGRDGRAAHDRHLQRPPGRPPHRSRPDTARARRLGSRRRRPVRSYLLGELVAVKIRAKQGRHLASSSSTRRPKGSSSRPCTTQR